MVLGILKKPLVEYKTKILKHLTGETDMNEVVTLTGAEPRKILQTVIEKKIPAVMSYLSKGKWYVAKVLLTNLGANRLDIRVSPRRITNREPQATSQTGPMDIQVNQPVGISLRYGYGKFIFETTVAALEPSPDPTSGGTIVLTVPDRIEIIQRRSYFRVDVPSSLKVKVMLWHCRYADQRPETQQIGTRAPHTRRTPPEHYWQGKLTNISAGGTQIVVDTDTGQKPDFKRGQLIGLRFTPMPYEMPLMFDAQIRNTLPTADGKSICLGLRIVGLEASPEGRQVLQRLCSVVEHYYQINQYSTKQQDLQTTSSPR